MIRAVLIEGLLSKFPVFFSRNFLHFHISLFFSPNIVMRSLPNILPSVKFPNFGNLSRFFGKIWKLLDLNQLI